MKEKIIPAPETRVQTKKLIQQFRLIDDDFMRVCLQNNKPAVQLILRIILGKPNLEVQKLETQKEAKKLAGRSVRFDVWARDGDAVVARMRLRWYILNLQKGSGILRKIQREKRRCARY